MIQSLGPASGGSSGRHIYPFSFFTAGFALSLSGGRLASPASGHTTRQFGWLPAQCPIPDIFCLEFVTSRVARGSFCKPLLAQTEAFHNLAIPIRVPAVQIVQQSPALVDHHDQSPPRRMVLDVALEVRCQIVDPLAQKRDLHFWGACVLNMRTELFDQRCFRCAQVPSPSSPKFSSSLRLIQSNTTFFQV